MKVFTLAALDSEPSDPNTFVGRARLTRMSDAAAHPQTNVYRVAFEAGARTNWHSHTGPQLLQIVEGTCRFQQDGESVREASVGDLISIEPGARHWHGATPAGPMTHIAINIDATTSWFEPVTDEDYAGQVELRGFGTPCKKTAPGAIPREASRGASNSGLLPPTHIGSSVTARTTATCGCSAPARHPV